MMKRLKSWWQNWQLAREAGRILAESAEDSFARLTAESILRGLRSGRLCLNCLKPFDAKPRTFSDNFRLRAIMSIPDSEADPVLCPSCFETAIGTFNPQATNIGTSNSGPSNLVLQKLS
jgi:hypothetical protein